MLLTTQSQVKTELFVHKQQVYVSDSSCDIISLCKVKMHCW